MLEDPRSRVAIVRVQSYNNYDFKDVMRTESPASRQQLIAEYDSVEP